MTLSHLPMLAPSGILEKVSLAPRLGAPVASISSSPSGRLICAALEDASVRCFSPQLEAVAAFSVSVVVPSDGGGGGLFWHAPTATIAYRR